MMVLIAFSAMGQSYNSNGSTGVVQKDQAQQPQSITVLNPISNATINKPYYFEVESFSQFTHLNVSFGDNSPNKSYPYNGSDYVNISHTYDVYGSYFINITVSYASPASNYSVLLRVDVGWGSVNSTQAVGYASILPSYSSLRVYNNSNIFSPGANISLYVYYLQFPSNYTYRVYSQNISMWRNGAIIERFPIPYTFNSTYDYYTAGYASSIVNRTSLGPGVYEFNITTFTGNIGTTGSVTNNTALSYIMDIAVEKGLTIFPTPSNGQSLTNAEDTYSGYVTFDGQIAYNTVSNEILDNTYLYLDSYNGSSSSSFVPMLASQLPTVANGGINNVTYSRTVPSMGPAGYANGPAVTYTYKPYQVYNFTIRSNATWQNGTPVTAYDVAYGIIRDMLFINGQPGTPAWMQGQVLLPNYAAFTFTDSNSFYNLTTNITWNNATNTVTFYLQAPESPQLVYELFAASGTYIMDPTWITAHAGGITWTPAGFAAYQAEANVTGYDRYFMNHIFADGPYELAYAIPGNLVVLRANPNYNPPGSWFPRPSIGTITILYVSNLNDPSYFLLKSAVAQIGGIPPSTWSEAVSLQDAGTVDIHSFPTLSLYFYNFNADVNMTMAASAFPGINMPGALFAAPLARKAFAYAYNYAYYLKDQEGNPLYPSTVFAYAYAGMLPAGMLYSQSIAQLNNTTNGVPYYDMGLAIHYWDEFLNSSEAANMSITHNSNMVAFYGGKMLEIPIITFQDSPQDEEGATTWGISLARMMGYGIANHTQFPAAPIYFSTLLTYQVYGQNPMPIYELGWAPDYPYPSDYMGPMADPAPSELYPGANAMFPGYIQTVNATESSILTSMANIFNESQAATNPGIAESLYHQLNEQLINMTFYVYLYQVPEYIISSSSIVQAKMVQYQENVMIGGGGDFLYNLVSYGSNVQTYTVTFTETGLPSGTSWSVTLNGTSESSTSGTITFSLPNGTYSYTVSSVSGYSVSPSSGSITVSGKNFNQAITFTPTTTSVSKYTVTFTETGLPSGTTWYVNVTGGNDYSSSNRTISFYSTNGTFTYVLSRPPLNYVLPVSSGDFTVDGKAVTVQIVYDRMAFVQFIVNTNDATLSINGVNQTMVSGSMSLYLNAGYYYINATDPGYLPYSNYVHLSYNGSYSYSISLKPVSNSGYLTGTVLPENATVSANGIIIPVSHGYFNASLSSGTYYVTATAYGYGSSVSVVNVTAGHASNLTISLKPSTLSSVTISGYIDPVNASLTVNGFDAYVNSTGYFHVSLPAGTYTVSAYEKGYYPYSVTKDFSSSAVINITLKPEPASTSTTSSSNVTSTGFNVTVSDITTGNGTISLKYSASSNGTIVVQIPYADMRNATISDILGSKVYANGTLYSNFSITITSNYTIILTVYGLKGDPVLTWAYIPSVSVTPPLPAAPPPASASPYLIYAIVAIVIVAAIAGVLVARRRKL